MRIPLQLMLLQIQAFRFWQSPEHTAEAWLDLGPHHLAQDKGNFAYHTRPTFDFCVWSCSDASSRIDDPSAGTTVSAVVVWRLLHRRRLRRRQGV